MKIYCGNVNRVKHIRGEWSGDWETESITMTIYSHNNRQLLPLLLHHRLPPLLLCSASTFCLFTNYMRSGQYRSILVFIGCSRMCLMMTQCPFLSYIFSFVCVFVSVCRQHFYRLCHFILFHWNFGPCTRTSISARSLSIPGKCVRCATVDSSFSFASLFVLAVVMERYK